MRSSNVATTPGPRPIGPSDTAAYNVLAGWLTNAPIPPVPKQRNQTRAGYRKTTVRRQRGHNRPPAASPQLPLAA